MIIDLCSGLGRFPGNNVISVDINKKTRPTILADIRFPPLRKGLKPDLCHASPPCRFFSYARIRTHGYDETGIAESLRLVASCFEAFSYLEAKTWTLENPEGVMKRILKPDTITEYPVYDIKRKRTMFYSNNKSLKRALIPQDVRQRILSVT